MLHRSFSYARRITCLTNEGQSRHAITFFHQLQKTGFKITPFLLSAVTRACGQLPGVIEGKQAHCMVLKHGFNVDVVLMTSLIDMYSKCTGIQDARRVFDELPERDIVATNSMISALFRYHLTMDAIKLFNITLQRDVGSWNSVISGLAHNSKSKMALFYFERMKVEGVSVDVMTMLSVISVCADIAALVNGKQIHGLVIKYGFELYLPVGNAAIDMYAKCGCMEDALKCFLNMGIKNVISWTSLIVGYGKHGLGVEALRTFDAMVKEGIVPNKITFLGTLYACSHAGLVQEGWRIYNCMVHKYSITPIMEHYTCMVDLLARAGCLNEAYSFMEKMPVKPDARLLTAFLSSCCSHMNVKLATNVGEKLLELEPEDAGAYMLLSNFYALAGDLQSVAKVRRLMLNRGIKKEKAYTWIEIDKKVHSFESGDRSHPLSKEIYCYLQNLVEKSKSIGYVPNTSMIMQNVDENTKEEMLLGHSEKLAIALGLIRTPSCIRIMIVKNLRVCVDCHQLTGFISKIEGREIVARDSSRFHHFKDGVCSCGNHW
ncbi:PPR domain-containing protein/PPR_2 domain-containing protein/DYW_deaminase domain-containing protein [Cephalotus follicularis]|uniref:PPR domain-containing protein/PPR_2 domain-containing protein/DYW_deaminase domain-containing protein n=1 Tax=Cephalotus follicularis TaxID=3775 RepID=A0A1Q3ASM3_CEPFO|nr:PPR domain-containing protein/PPR_2 domain-containing protein/DYW_deaminase domain-containing protein [Cephalotus follicularis]